MASSMFEKQNVKKFRVFRNGDPQFLGKDIAVSRQHAKNWDVFLEKITTDLHNTEAVRELCTPVGGTPIRSFDDLEDRQCYVAIGRNRFRDIGYLSLNEQHGQPVITTSRRNDQAAQPPRMANRKMPDVRSRLLDNTQTGVISIYVYSNGDSLEQPKRVTIPRRNIANLDLVMAEVNQYVKLTSGAARLLYTTDGQLIYEPEHQLENRGFYVAVGSEFGGFKSLNYGAMTRPAFTTYANEKKYSNRKSDDGRGNRYQNGHRFNNGNHQNGDDSGNTSANSSIPAEVWKSNRRGASKSHDGTSHARIFRYENNRLENVRHSVESEHPRRNAGGPFHAKPRAQDGRHTFRAVDYDRDEGGIFKSKRISRETADQVQENEETRTDLPIDHMRAEQIPDEDEPKTGRRPVGLRAGVKDGNTTHRQVKQPPGRQPPQQAVKQGQGHQPYRPPPQKPVESRFDDDDEEFPEKRNVNRINNNTINTKASSQFQQGQGQGQIRRPQQQNGNGSMTDRSVLDREDARDDSDSSSQYYRQQEKRQAKQTYGVTNINGQKRVSHIRTPSPKNETSRIESPESPTKNGALSERRDHNERQSEKVNRRRGPITKNTEWDEERSPPAKKFPQQKGDSDNENDRIHGGHKTLKNRQAEYNGKKENGKEDNGDEDNDDDERNSRRRWMVVANRKQFDGSQVSKAVKRAVDEKKTVARDERWVKDDDDERMASDERYGQVKRHQVGTDTENRTEQWHNVKVRKDRNEDDEDDDDNEHETHRQQERLKDQRIQQKQRQHEIEKQGQGHAKKIASRDDDDAEDQIIAEDASQQMTYGRVGRKERRDSEENQLTYRSD